jgi:LPS-assembly lipoprotein
MRYSLLLITLLLTACGFTPMYGSLGDSDVKTALNNIQISNIPDHQGLQLRNNLIDRFYHDGRPADPVYFLDIVPIQESKTDLDLTKNATATRSQLTVSTTMKLSDKRTGQILLERGLTSSASYDILDSRFTTRVSEDNAEQNALEDLARQIEQQIVLYLHRK